MFPLNIYRSGSGSVGRGSEHRADGLPVILDDLLAILFHSGMKEGTRRDNYDRSVRVLDGGSVLHHGTDIHQIVAVLIDGASEQSDKSPISQNALGDGIDQEAGIDQGFAGALALDGAFGELDERLSAGSLAADAALDLPDQEQRILDRRLTQGEGETGPGFAASFALALSQSPKRLTPMQPDQFDDLVGDYAEQSLFFHGLNTECVCAGLHAIFRSNILDRQNTRYGVDFVVQVLRWSLDELERKGADLLKSGVIRAIESLAGNGTQKHRLLSGRQDEFFHIIGGADLFRIAQKSHRSLPCS